MQMPASPMVVWNQPCLPKWRSFLTPSMSLAGNAPLLPRQPMNPHLILPTIPWSVERTLDPKTTNLF